MTTNSSQAQAHYDAAIQHEIAGNLSLAITEMEKAVECGPDFYDAWVKLGVYRSEIDRVEEAEKAFDQAQDVDPNRGDAYFEKAVVLLKQERYKEALAELGQISPDDPRAIGAKEQERAIQSQILNQKGRALGDQKRWDAAVEAFRESLEHLPGNVDSRMGLALALYGTNQIDDALAEVRKVLDKQPDNFHALHLCADLLMELVKKGDRHHLREACACYQSALELVEDPELKQVLRLSLAQAERLPLYSNKLGPTPPRIKRSQAGLTTYIQVGWLVTIAISILWYIPLILVVKFAADRSLDFGGDTEILVLGTIASGALIGFMAYANDVQGKAGPNLTVICHTLGMLIAPVWSFVLSLLLAWHYSSWLVAGAGIGLTLLFSLRCGGVLGKAIGQHLESSR